MKGGGPAEAPRDPDIRADAWRRQVCPLPGRPRLRRRASRPFGSYPTPMTDENHTPKQVALDHQGIEAGHVLLRLAPTQNQCVPDHGGFLIHGWATTA